MKQIAMPPVGTKLTLQDVLGRLAAAGVAETRRRDLKSAVVSYGKLIGKEPHIIALDLGEIRRCLDRMVPAEAQVSAKRWTNLRSDLASAIEASGLVIMLKTAGVDTDEAWKNVMVGAPRGVREGLSRFARWATLRNVGPEAVDDAVIARFMTELEVSTLVRSLRDLERKVAKSWNALVRVTNCPGLKEVTVRSFKPAPTRLTWETLPSSFQEDLEAHLAWCALPDPLNEHARVRALASRSRRLRRDQIHSAVSAAVAAGVRPDRLVSLAVLVEPEVVRAFLGQLWKENGKKLTAYVHGLAGALIAIAKEWVRVSADKLDTLKGLRGKLGKLPAGMTIKNEDLLRRFDDPKLKRGLIGLPDRIWREARKKPPTSRRAFLLYQDALGLDLQLHAPMRPENLCSLTYDRHLHWPQGQGKPALLVLGADETKNNEKIEFELGVALSDRLWAFRHAIAPRLLGSKPDHVFVTWTGTPRCQGTVSLSIRKAIRKRLGIHMTPHQFRHASAKIHLDENPGAFELVRQLLGHKNLRTTIGFYTGINTKRAGRAHSKLLMELKEQSLAAGRRHRRKRDEEE